jgi:NAD(P)-dependent dehydrogenase (short-subunit alcohol dehydrogenase family)
MNVDLTGLNVLVTGASRGIGRAIAEEMIKSGAKVGVHYHRKKDEAEEIVRGTNGGSAVFQADLTDAASCHRLFTEALDVFGRIDVLVNNAGIAVYTPLDAPVEDYAADWHLTLSANLVSTAILCRDAIVHFQQIGGGRIINIASRAAFRGDTPVLFAYAASKGGMVALSRSIARAYGKDGVKSFVIAPGFTKTDMADEFIKKYGDENALKDIALERMTEPGDIAPLAVLLASGLADHATGTSIDVNAGSYVR